MDKYCCWKQKHQITLFTNKVLMSRDNAEMSINYKNNIFNVLVSDIYSCFNDNLLENIIDEFNFHKHKVNQINN